MKNEISIIENMVSWQGEGPDTGKRALILRFKKCNKIESGNGCSWCDTKVKLRISNSCITKLENIQETINIEKCGLLITGGECTFGDQLEQTITMLNYLEYPYANVESNGFQLKELISKINTPPNDVKFIYSPKIFSDEDYDIEFNTLKEIYDDPRLFVKIVYDSKNIYFINEFLVELDKLKINNKVYLMPKGITRKELLENSPEVFDAAEKFKVGFSSRTHIMYGFV